MSGNIDREVMKRIYAVCHGTVQGVGFRFFVQREAVRLGLTGWVRNLSNGSVDMEIDGEEPAFHAFFERIQNDHPWARVRSINRDERPVTKPYEDFHIKF